MSYSRKNVELVNREFEQRRADNKATQQKNLKKAYSLCPELMSVDNELSRVGMEIFALAMKGKEYFDANIGALKEKNENLQKRRTELLISVGLSSDFTDLKYDCTLCDDTGYIEAKMCKCYKQALTLKGYESSGLSRLLDAQSFESFTLDAYPEEARPVMKKNYTKLKKFANEFSERKESFLLAGNTGLGKTHLSSAVAKHLIENGYDVVYEIAQNIFSDFDTDRFRDRYGDSEILSERYFDCDLLIIDDLGTEIVTSNTESYLYNIINTRLNKNLPIIINTNLTGAEIEKLYHQRITSRLFGEFTILKFEGSDVRRRTVETKKKK